MDGETRPHNVELIAADGSAARSQFTIQRVSESDHLAWDSFVLNHRHGTPFHLTAWKKTIQESFGYEPVYLLARGEDNIRGVLPLFFVKNAIIGKALISSPFAVYGGILADGPETLRALYQCAVAIGFERRVQYVEFRNSSPEQCVGTPNLSRYVGFTHALLRDEQAILEGLPKKTRNIVRKALKQPFRMEYRVQNVSNFDALYARNMRRLGTPCFSPKYFDSLIKNFGSMVDVREVWMDGMPVAASLNFLFRDDMHIYYAAADTRFNHLGPNTYMYFDHLCWAGRNGYRTFDFGRCKRGTSVFDFKKHWNTTMRDLPYEIVLVMRKELPNFSPANPRFHLAIRLWQKVPLRVTRMLGPALIRMFP